MGRCMTSCVVAGVVAVLTLGSCAAPGSELPSVVAPPLLPGGTYRVETWSVEKNALARYDEDLVIEAEGDIVIAGTLRGVPRPPDSEGSDGAHLVLRSKTRIVISGELLGAPGRHGSLHPRALAMIGHDAVSWTGTAEDASEQLIELLTETGDPGIDLSFLNGGDGGTITLDAPEVFVNVLRAASAGHGGPTGNGGTGGHLTTPNTTFAWADGSPGSFGGRGGNAGHGVAGIRAGRGGEAGRPGEMTYDPPLARRD